MWRESGFGTEADQMKKGTGPAALSDRLLDSFCLFGPVTRCQERLAAYRAAGVALPILNPPIGPRRRARGDPRIREVGHRGGAADPGTPLS
jgi:hypothetical protein